jgi:hypothetical protein
MCGYWIRLWNSLHRLLIAWVLCVVIHVESTKVRSWVDSALLAALHRKLKLHVCYLQLAVLFAAHAPRFFSHSIFRV